MPDWDCHANFHFLLSSETVVQVYRNKNYPYRRFNSVYWPFKMITMSRSGYFYSAEFYTVNTMHIEYNKNVILLNEANIFCRILKS